MIETRISKILEGYRNKAFRPSELLAHYGDKIAKHNGPLNAILQTKPDEVSKRAKWLDDRATDIDRLPLYGVPLVVKDNILVKGWRAAAGSKILENYISPYTATCVERLEAAGAVVIGIGNCDEFAMGSSNENSAFGSVKNPWDLERVSGGSSGGSAAAVAAALAPASLGTETGGSVRQPASLCGIVGVKPSYGRVSRYGVIAYASSLDQVGPFGKDVWDSGRLLEVMAGYDPLDATTSKSAVPKLTETMEKASLKGAIIGVAKEWLEGAEPEIVQSFNEAVSALKNAGAVLKDISLPHAKYALSTYYLIAPSEASSNLARYDGVHYGHRTAKPISFDDVYKKSRGEGFGKEVKLRIMLGTYALSAGYFDAYYLKANAVRRFIQQDFEEVFKQCQVVISPTSPTTAFKIGEKSDDPLKMYLSDIYTIPANLAGLVGLSVPCGLDKKKLPIGLQLLGKPFDEGPVFGIARQYEKIRGEFPWANTK